MIRVYTGDGDARRAVAATVKKVSRAISSPHAPSGLPMAARRWSVRRLLLGVNRTFERSSGVFVSLPRPFAVILKAERQGKGLFAPSPTGDPPTVQCVGKARRKNRCMGLLSRIRSSPGIATTARPTLRRGAGCRHIESRQTRLLPSFRVIVGVSTLTRQNL